jgi:hypothetical protein
MIRPLHPSKIPTPYARRKRAILDLEWDPDSYELRVCGTLHRGRYRDHGTIENFLNWFLMPENAGIEVWAHYGGRADFCFLIPALVNAGIQCEGLVAGSSVFSLTCKVGRRRHHLRDSFHLFLSSLDQAGRTFAKRGKTECSFYAPIKELREYNEHDCRLLDDSLLALDDYWGELGTRIGLTNASTAFSLYRARYLKREIPTNPSINDVFRRRAFFCSIVAPFVRSVRCALNRAGAPFAQGFDQNSAHPASYAGPMPGPEIEGGLAPKPGCIWWVDADIRVPEGVHIPPIPTRTSAGRIVFPTGRWRAILCQEQVAALEQCGGGIDKAHWYYCFEPEYSLAEFARDLFEIKRAAAKDGNKGLVTVSKYAINSGGFGKFAESPNRMMLVTGELSPSFLYDQNGEPKPEADNIRILSPSLALVPSFRPAPHEHVPMAAQTGARTMTRIIEDMWKFEKRGAIVLYVDTDGFKSTYIENPPLRLGEGLGEYKLEYPRIEDGYFAGPKFYGIKDTELERTILRAKSFPTARYGEVQTDGSRRGHVLASDERRPLTSLITYEKMRSAALRGLELDIDEPRPTDETIRIEFERMRRIPETIAGYKPGDDLMPGKRLIGKEVKAPRPSRCFDSSGFSRPWAIEEL